MTEPSKPPSFTVLMGPLSGKEFVVDEPGENILIGSDPSCNVCIPGAEVSPIHAKVTIDENGIQIHDTQSPHGLAVNDDRVSDKGPLRNGDVVWLGAPGEPNVVMIQCHLPEVAAAPPAPEPVPEEAGLAAGHLEFLVDLYPSPGMTDSVCSIFVATGCTPVAHDRQGPEERAMEVLHLPMDDALDMIDRGEINDAKTVVGLMAADRRLRA